MRFWRTKDGPTNSNLALLEDLARPRPDIDAEEFLDRIRAVIGLREMLPKAVLRHFDPPDLYVCALPYQWVRFRLQERATELATALEEGLAAAYVDAALGHGGDADLTDRPSTRGEEIKAALAVYREDRDPGSLAGLRQACSPTRLASRVASLERWLARRRPSSPHRSIEYEIASILGDIGRDAGDLHHEPASSAFSERMRSSAEGAGDARSAALGIDARSAPMPPVGTCRG